MMGDGEGNKKRRETTTTKKIKERQIKGVKQDKRGRKRRTTGAENPLGNSGVAKMMCEPVISRHAQSLKLWLLAWLSMIDIYLQKPVIHQCHISVGCETTNSGLEQKCFMASPIYPKLD